MESHISASFFLAVLMLSYIHIIIWHTILRILDSDLHTTHVAITQGGIFGKYPQML